MERNYKVGMRATMKEVRWSDKKEEELSYRVTQVNDNSVEFNEGRTIWDLMGNLLKNNGALFVSRQFYPADLQVGKRWRTQYSRGTTDGIEVRYDVHVRVKERVSLEVPAGKFDTYLIQAEGYRSSGNAQNRLVWKMWVAPGVPFDIAYEYSLYSGGRLSQRIDRKLTSFQSN